MCFRKSNHFKVVLLIEVLYLTFPYTQLEKTEPNIFVSIDNGTSSRNVVVPQKSSGVATNLTNDSKLLDDNEGENTSDYILSENYPEPYLLTSGFSRKINVEEGYYIDITIEDLDLDGAAGDYLSIKSDLEQVLTWTVKTPKILRSADNFFNINFVVQPRKDPMAENTHRGFKLKWERSNEIVATTPKFESTTPDINNIPYDQIETIVVYVTAEDPEDFLENKIKFEEMLVKMSTKYCEKNEIPLKNEITLNNIIMSNITYCPITWPNYMDCIQIRFGIPVILNNTAEETNSTYELSSEHLSEMWDEYCDDMLPKIGLREFPVPNLATHLEVWIGVSIIIVIFFFILLVVLWKFDFFEMDVRPVSSYGDPAFDYEEHKHRPSDLSLYPLPHQAIPPLFDAPDDLFTEFTSVDTQSIDKSRFPLYEPESLYGNTNSQKDLYYTPPPSYTTESSNGNMEVFEYENPAFVNDEENVIFQRGHHRN